MEKNSETPFVFTYFDMENNVNYSISDGDRENEYFYNDSSRNIDIGSMCDIEDEYPKLQDNKESKEDKSWLQKYAEEFNISLEREDKTSKEKNKTILELKSELERLKKLNIKLQSDLTYCEMNKAVVESELEKIESENIKLKEYAGNLSERRCAEDGNTYTYSEFIEYYGVIEGTEIWNSLSYYVDKKDNSEIQIKDRLTQLERLLSKNLAVTDRQEAIIKNQAQIIQEQKSRVDILENNIKNNNENNIIVNKNIETTVTNIYDDIFRMRTDYSERLHSLEQKSEWVVPQVELEMTPFE